jgi:hypothetical protein
MQGVDMTATSKAYARSGIGAPPLRRGEPAIVDVESFTIDDHLSASKLRAPTATSNRARAPTSSASTAWSASTS